MHPTAPNDPVILQRMRNAHRRARHALGVLPDHPHHEVWGWRGRTLSEPVIAPDGPAWLRLACAPTKQTDSTYWDGSIEADQAIPHCIPRPHLRDTHDWSDEPWKYRAELYDRAPTGIAATRPMLTTSLNLPPSWWDAVRTALDHLSTVQTQRHTITQDYLDRAMPYFLGTPIDTITPHWTTAHGDFHLANLCTPTLHILDWEGWGLAPTGYDAAVLHTYSLLVPHLAASIRHELGHLLLTPTGRFAELVAITELLHSTTRGDNLQLIAPLHNRAALLLGRAIPTPQWSQTEGARR